MRVLLNLALPLCLLAALASVIWLAIPHTERWRTSRVDRRPTPRPTPHPTPGPTRPESQR